MLTPTTVAADTLKLWHFLPPFVQEQDEVNGYQFLTWLNGIGLQQQIIDTLCRDTGATPGWSIILNVTRCPAYALPWLAQFVGVRFTNTQIGNEDAMRSAIIAKGNFARGTPTAIKASIQQYLSPAGSVTIIERYPDAYSFTVVVRGELQGLTYAQLAIKDPIYSDVADTYPFYNTFPKQEITVITAAVQASTPAGLVATVVEST